jgi:hypothetical protein
VIGGSNANRLTTAAFTDLEKKVETTYGGGWKVTKESVDTLLPTLKAKIELLDPAAPIILWCMTTTSSTATCPLSLEVKTGTFMRPRTLWSPPLSLLRDMLTELNRTVL